MASDWAFDKLVFTGHAPRQMFARRITADEVRIAVSQGEPVADYPDDKPYPSRLLLAFVDARPMHVVLGYDELSRVG